MISIEIALKNDPRTQPPTVYHLYAPHTHVIRMKFRFALTEKSNRSGDSAFIHEKVRSASFASIHAKR